jgi:hypothetical protein
MLQVLPVLVSAAIRMVCEWQSVVSVQVRFV